MPKKTLIEKKTKTNEANTFKIKKLTPKEKDAIIVELKKKLKSAIKDGFTTEQMLIKKYYTDLKSENDVKTALKKQIEILQKRVKIKENYAAGLKDIIQDLKKIINEFLPVNLKDNCIQKEAENKDGCQENETKRSNNNCSNSSINNNEQNNQNLFYKIKDELNTSEEENELFLKNKNEEKLSNFKMNYLFVSQINCILNQLYDLKKKFHVNLANCNVEYQNKMKECMKTLTSINSKIKKMLHLFCGTCDADINKFNESRKNSVELQNRKQSLSKLSSSINYDDTSLQYKENNNTYILNNKKKINLNNAITVGNSPDTFQQQSKKNINCGVNNITPVPDTFNSKDMYNLLSFSKECTDKICSGLEINSEMNNKLLKNNKHNNKVYQDFKPFLNKSSFNRSYSSNHNSYRQSIKNEKIKENLSARMKQTIFKNSASTKLQKKNRDIIKENIQLCGKYSRCHTKLLPNSIFQMHSLNLSKKYDTLPSVTNNSTTSVTEIKFNDDTIPNKYRNMSACFDKKMSTYNNVSVPFPHTNTFLKFPKKIQVIKNTNDKNFVRRIKSHQNLPA